MKKKSSEFKSHTLRAPERQARPVPGRGELTCGRTCEPCLSAASPLQTGRPSSPARRPILQTEDIHVTKSAIGVHKFRLLTELQREPLEEAFRCRLANSFMMATSYTDKLLYKNSKHFTWSW